MAPAPCSRHGGLAEAEEPLHQQGDEAGLAVEEEKRDHADQRRQHRGQRDQPARIRPPGRS